VRLSKRFYRLLLRFYPARFREEYGGPLERQFLDEYGELRGFVPRALFWLRAIADLGTSIPSEVWREVRQDLAHAVRVYRRRPVTVGLALAALAVTIGVTTGVFSVVNALLLRSLPFRDPERLVEAMYPSGNADGSIAEFRGWVESRPYLSDAAQYRTSSMTFDRAGDASSIARRVPVAETSANFFRLLGRDPLIGRPFADGEDVPGRDKVAILSYGFWHQLGADPRLLGSTIHLNGVPLTVTGIGPPGLDFPMRPAIWTPTGFDVGLLFREHAILGTLAGRLQAGVTLKAANQQYRAGIAKEMRARGVKVNAASMSDVRLVPLRDRLAGDVRRISLVLFGVVLFVLLTACANVAHLLLSRITERQKEMSLRAALGASRARLMQQLVTETTVLTATAAAAGLLVARWVVQLVAVVQPPSLTAQTYSVLDWRVVIFAAALAVLTGLVFGVLPARFLRYAQPSMDPLRVAAGHSTGVTRLRSVLVAGQATFTVVLLAGALTMCRSFLKLAETDLGMKTDRVVTLTVSISGTPRQKDGAAYYRSAVERLRAVPGVESAGAVEYLPLAGDNMVMFPFHTDRNPAIQEMVGPLTATAEYMRSMGTSLVTGRDFTADEEAASEPVAIVNEALARKFDPDMRVVGQHLIPPFDSLKPLTIVGVVRNQLYSPTSGSFPMLYHLPGWLATDNLTLVARVRGDETLYLPICRDAVRSVDARVPVYDVTTLDQRLRGTLSRPRFYTTAVVFLGGFALLLAVIGIYGVASFSIAQRTHEIGVRLAIGAQPSRVRAMLLREGLLPVGCGLAAGVASAMALGKVVGYLVAGADAVGFAGCLAGAFVLAAAASLAVWSATRRIAGLDPIRVLRAE